MSIKIGDNDLVEAAKGQTGEMLDRWVDDEDGCQ